VLDVTNLPESIVVDGIPFAPDWTGDVFQGSFLNLPFHLTETNYPGGVPPEPTETVDVCVVGGGMSGLSTAYLLRRFRPVVLELWPRFGGVAKGESWRGVPYSMGGAYFMVPDPGSFLEGLYHELGVDRLYKLSKDPDPVELNGELINDIFHSPRVPEKERQALATYKKWVNYFFNNYPDIPLIPDRDNRWIIELDKISFKDDVTARLGYPIPPILWSVIQDYFLSSFGAGAERVSAASGWNFIAAEEGGRWVLPGGNSGLVTSLYNKLAEMETSPGGCAGQYLRAGCHAVDVRMLPDGLAKVTYKDSTGAFRALRARRVVMSCSKHIAKHILTEPLRADPVRTSALQELETMGYIVANVLMDAPTTHSFYDLYMYGNAQLPVDEESARLWSRITDVVDGAYAVHASHSHAVLTCYWPLPWLTGRATLVPEDAWHLYTQAAAPQVKAILDLLGVPHRSVVQARLTRWGHAFPVARVGMIANGTLDKIRAPMNDTIYFVDQDNWMLPAVETCLLEAADMAPKIAAGL
jgi:hypothetical protein